MRRGLLLAMSVLVACGSSGSPNPSATEKQRRGIILAQTILQQAISPSVSEAGALDCSFDSGGDVRDYQVAIQRGNKLDDDTIARQLVVIDMSACPKSRWEDIPAAVAATGVASESQVAALVAEGRAAIGG